MRGVFAMFALYLTVVVAGLACAIVVGLVGQ